MSSLFLASVTAQTSPYDPWADLDDDGDIDIFDIVDIAGRYGTTGTPINKTALLLELQSRVENLTVHCLELEERIAFLEALLLDRGLIGYWGFDEGSGTIAYDLSGYHHHGAIHGSCSWTDGIAGKALWFGGGGSFVQVLHSDDLSFSGVQPFTLEAWIKPDGPQGQSTQGAKIIDKGTNYGLVHDHPTSEMRGVIFLSDSWRYSGEVNITAGSWQHYVGVYSPPYLIAYLNSSEVARREVGFLSLNNNTKNVVFGTNTGLTSQYSGLIDEIRIYNRALNASEIMEHYTRFLP